MFDKSPVVQDDLNEPIGSFSEEENSEGSLRYPVSKEIPSVFQKANTINFRMLGIFVESHKASGNLDDSRFIPLTAPPLSHLDDTLFMMGATWQTPEQITFFAEHLPLYSQHLDDDTVTSNFWPTIEKSWFEKWPVAEPSPELIEEKGGLEKARKEERTKMVAVSTFFSAVGCVNTNSPVHPENQARLQEVDGWGRQRPESPPARQERSAQAIGSSGLYELVLRLANQASRCGTMGRVRT